MRSKTCSQWIYYRQVTQSFYGILSKTQTETDIVAKKDNKKEWWKRKPAEVSVKEPWEDEVDDLVAWTNSLDTDALED